MKKSFIIFIAIVINLLLLMGCSGAVTQEQPETNANQTQTPAQTQSVAPTLAATQTQTQSAAPTQVPIQTQLAAGEALQAADAAKAAADADDSGAPYFVAYDYDETNYLVSSYQTQESPGNYSGGGELYLVNKETGEVLKNNQADLSKVDFSKFLTVYSKLSGEIIE